MSSSFRGGLPVTDRSVWLELDLQGSLRAAVELIVPGLVVVPSLVSPGLGAAGLTVPGKVAPDWVIAGMGAPQQKASGGGHQASPVTGREVRVLRSG